MVVRVTSIVWSKCQQPTAHLLNKIIWPGHQFFFTNFGNATALLLLVLFYLTNPPFFNFLTVCSEKLSQKLSLSFDLQCLQPLNLRLCKSDYRICKFKYQLNNRVISSNFFYLVLSIFVLSYSFSFVFFVSISEYVDLAQVCSHSHHCNSALCDMDQVAHMGSINL